MSNKRLNEIQAEMLSIAGIKRPSADDDARFLALSREAKIILTDCATRGGIERGSRADSGGWNEDDGVLDVRSAAHRRIESAVRAGLPDGAAERSTALLERGNPRSQSTAAQWINVAGDPAYLRAFQKLVRDSDRGHLLWTEQERHAFASVQEFRALALNPDSTGGYMVPFSLDPSVLLTSGGSASELRKVARVETIVTDSWNGVTSQGVVANWKAEAQESTDDSPTFAQPVVPVHRGTAFVPFSMELQMDAPRFAEQMNTLLVDAADQLMTTAYTVGTGSGQPEGLITGVTAGGDSSVVNVGNASAINDVDVYKLQAALPPRFQQNARFMGALVTINKVAALESTNGAKVFPFVDATPSTLLRKPLNELSTMDATVDGVTNYALVYGDFSQFLIVDRIGTTVELVPHLFGSAHRPTGQRGFFMNFRTGSKVLVKNAFRVLDVQVA